MGFAAQSAIGNSLRPAPLCDHRWQWEDRTPVSGAARPMKCLAVLALVLSCFVAAPVLAQATDSGSYTYCQVEDTGKRDIWVSQVFPTPPGTDFMGSALATEFHTYVGTLGGAGNKSCLVAASRADAEQTRAKIAAIMGKRTFGIRVYDWHDVNWTPSAATYANTASPPATAATSHVYCRFVDTDARVLVASAIFAQTLPAKTDAAYYEELRRFGAEFGAQAGAAQGVNGSGALCIGSDTRAEAEKSRADYRASFPFSGIKKVDLPFTPGPAPLKRTAAIAPPIAALPSAASTQPVAARSAGPIDDVEEDFWRRISSSKQAADFDDYLAAYPQGRHAPVARLESRRLHGGAAPAASADPDYPIYDKVSQLIASAAFFKIPAGSGEPVRRTGSRLVNKTVPMSADNSARRLAGGNQCRVDQKILTGAGGMFTTTATGLTWAGIVPLSLTSKMSSQYGVTGTIFKTVSIDKLEGQPFPLTAGGSFGWSANFESITRDTGTATRFGQDWRCQVGATAPATTSIPGLAGEQTEIQCHVEFVSLALPPQDQVFVWYSAPGCFLQDTSR